MTLRDRQVYSATDYAEALARYEPGPERSFVGLVKPGTVEGTILYAHPASCANWIQLPLAHLEGIEHLGNVTCGDHAHARAQLSFKHSADEAHEALLSLALLHQNVGRKLMGAVGGYPNCPPGQHPCIDHATGNWTCCNG